MKELLLCVLLGVLPAQKLSPIPRIVLPPPSEHTNLLLYWSPNYDPTYLWSEVWHSSNGSDWHIYPRCSYTNYLLVPMNNWETNISAVYDTNDNFIGWQTNAVCTDIFFTVDVEMWSRRLTNYTWTATQ